MARISGILSLKSRTAKQSGKLSVDFPKTGEKVNRGHYAVRISGAAGECQASIDGGPWQDCRAADGFFWFDWSPEQAGAHRISARTRLAEKWVKAERTCSVI